MRKFFYCFVFSFLFSSPAFLCAEELAVPSLALLPNTVREMKTPGFWISRHLSPDKIVLSEKEILEFNGHVRQTLKLTHDVINLSLYFSGLDLINELNGIVDDLRRRELYLGETKAKDSFYDDIRKKMNINAVRLELKPQPGLIVHFADQRFLPTQSGLYAKPNDAEFDELQNSDLDAGTPVVVLHESLDGKWSYVRSDIASGWVEKEKVAISGIADFKKFMTSQSFVVITKAKADIYLDKKLTQYYDYVRMGVRLPMLSETGDAVEISLPLRNEDGTVAFRSGFIKKTDAHTGYLSYTPRHIIEQAFELLNAPYGWGGMHGEQDCSRFLQEVFATVGINLPRDSKNQAKVGLKIAEFDATSTDDDRIFALQQKAGPGVTLLAMKGHIMLFLGIVDDRPYVIHAPWAYRTKEGSRSVAHVINRVAVTDLSLGEGSPKGSLLHRLSSVVLMVNPK